MQKIIRLSFLFGLIAFNISAENFVSWLPSADKREVSANPKLEKFLKEVKSSFRVLSCMYENSTLKEKQLIDDSDNKGTKWEYDLIIRKVKDEKDALDLIFSFRLAEGNMPSAGVAIAFDIYDWDADNYVMIPASVYNGNRNRIVNREYATGLDRSDLYRKDLPLTTCDVPQLSPETGKRSCIEVNTSNTTTPAMCFYSKRSKQAFIVLAEQGISVGEEIVDHAFIIEENEDRTQASFVISAPGVREQKPEFIGFGKSRDRGVDWKEGDELEIKLRVYTFRTSGIPGLLERFMSVRKSVTGPNHPRNLIPFSEVANIMTDNIDKRFYEGEAGGFYCPENANWISFGWIGGLMNTFPMLVLDDEKHRERVCGTFDFAIPAAQGESGYFYGAIDHTGKVFGREGYDDFPEIVLTRKNADVLFWMIKQFMVLKEQGKGNSIKPEWEQNVKRLADAFVNTWKQNKHWGNFLNNKTGEIAVYNTTSGAMAIGGLTLACVYYNDPEYLTIAKEAALYYYNEDFVRYGMTTGGCADILQNADSETAAAFMTSLMTLYECTGEKSWLDKCRDLANLCATWTVSFDYILPPDTPLAKLNAKLAGAVWASTQNKHGAPGFCTQAGEALFKIYRETGDERYASLIHDIAHAHAEGIQPNGLITERLTYCDADSRGSRGDGGKTGWNETNGAMIAMELPGIYLRTDIDRFFVFDHLEGKVLERNKENVIIEIRNPTPYNATVSILAENSGSVKSPLGATAFLNWHKVEIKAGETILVQCNKRSLLLNII